MKRLLAVAILATSCNALAETYICVNENATMHVIHNKSQKWEPIKYSGLPNFVFKNAIEDGIYNRTRIDGTHLTTCSTKGVWQQYEDTIVCNSRYGQFRLNTKENRYIEVSIDQKMDFYDTFTTTEFGTCELFKE